MVYDRAAAKRRIAAKFKRARARAGYRRVPRPITYPKSVSATKGRALLSMSNRTPKTMEVKLVYKQMLRMTQNSPNVAQYPLASGFPFRVSMNSPMANDILHVHNNGHGTQTYAQHNHPTNLSAKLAETGLPDRYNFFYVKSSTIEVVVQNQINQQGLIDTLDNESIPTPGGTGRTSHLIVTPRTLTGELVNCAHVTEDKDFNLNPETVNDIRLNIAGSVLKESLAFPHTRGASNKFSYTYGPRKRFDFRDVKDNLTTIAFTADGAVPTNQETYFNMCIGKQLFPSTQLLDSALQTIDIKVTYTVCAFNPKGGLGSNDPVPVGPQVHRGDF